jgi:uncharacterized protein YggU (UPF0235/DUF167 family)
MLIYVKAKPGAKAGSIKQLDGLFGQPGEIHLSVAVKEPATENRANHAILQALARHFGVPPSRVQLLRGATARNKVFEIK